MAQEKQTEVNGGILTLESNKNSKGHKEYYLTFVTSEEKNNDSFFIPISIKKDALNVYDVLKRKFERLDQLEEEISLLKETMQELS